LGVALQDAASAILTYSPVFSDASKYHRYVAMNLIEDMGCKSRSG
jgi:hypothetical protein